MDKKRNVRLRIEEFEREIMRLKQDYELAIHASDPKIALMKAREMAEGICKQIYQRKLSADPRGKTLHPMINTLLTARAIPAYMEPLLRTVQSYGNIGAHFLGKDAPHITAEYAQPCLEVLSKIIEWYADAYRPVQAMIVVRNPLFRERLQAAQQKGLPELKLDFQETPEASADLALLEECQTAAKTVQALPQMFVFENPAPDILKAVTTPCKIYKDWGHNVFSFIVAVPDELVSVELRDEAPFRKALYLIETILAYRQTKPIARQRRIDAAVPSYAEVNQAFKLLIQVRLPDSPFLDKADWPSKQKPVALEQIAQAVTIAFPFNNRTGELLPVQLQINVTAPDFVIHGDARKQIEIPPEKDSQPVSFLLTAQKKGVRPIEIEVYSLDNIHLGTLAVETTVDGVTSPAVTVLNLFLMIGEEMPQRPQFHIALENRAAIQISSQQILWQITPEQAGLTAGYIGALVEMLVNGKTVNVNAATSISGGFKGSTHLMVMVIVPVLVEVLSRLLNLVGENSLEDLKQNRVKLAMFENALRQLSVDDLHAIVKRIGSAMDRRKIQHLTQAIKDIIASNLAV